MDTSTSHFRDCVRDVVALVESCVALQLDTGERDLHSQNIQVLLDNADLTGCLRVAVSMVATNWVMVAHSRSQHRGTELRAELDSIFAMFRSATSG